MATSWAPFEIGRKATWTRTIGARKIELYAELTGDRNPLHFDEAFASQTRGRPPRRPGGIATGLFNALVAMELPGPGSVFLHQGGLTPRRSTLEIRSRLKPPSPPAEADKPITTWSVSPGARTEPEVLRGRCVVYTMLTTD